MKRILIGMFFIAPNAYAFQDVASVVSIENNYVTTSVPYQVCQTDQVPIYSAQQPRGTSDRDTMVGMLIGGALGNSVGKGDGRKAATAVGALIGYNAGKSPGKSGIIGYRSVERCQTSYRKELVQDGYVVTYSYNGNLGQSMMKDLPGEQINVRVDISPE